MINIKGICYIVAACKEYLDVFNLNPKENDLVIAADGGYDLIKDTEITPDVLLGDFDSISTIPEYKEIIKHPSEKDDTDTFLAYKLGFARGYRNFVIIGGIGGRIDHTIANIRTLSCIANDGGRGFLLGNNFVLTSIADSISFPETCTGYISIFSNEDISKDVKITGLKYETDNINLISSTTLGTSNEFIGERAQISVKEGNLLIVWYENIENFMLNINNYVKKDL